jgi:ABC-2 type transport system ATP-binding protein
MAGRSAAVFLSTHILEIAERMCDRIGIIHQGRLIAVGTMDELRAGSLSPIPAASGNGSAAGHVSLEDIFLGLTGGAEYAEIAEILK